MDRVNTSVLIFTFHSRYDSLMLGHPSSMAGGPKCNQNGAVPSRRLGGAGSNLRGAGICGLGSGLPFTELTPASMTGRGTFWSWLFFWVPMSHENQWEAKEPPFFWHRGLHLLAGSPFVFFFEW